MMTIHKLTAGDGYTYLTRQIADGDTPRQRGQDAADYFTATGNPPGQWAGRGAELLGVAGQQVTEAQMKALFGMGMHPLADQIIAEYLASHVTAGMDEAQLAAAAQRAEAAASLGAPFPAYQPLTPFARRVAGRVTALEEAAGRPATPGEVKKIQAAEARRSRAAVAGFDVVFAPVKSAALVWAVDHRAEVRAAVRAAHEAARDAALGLLEEHAALTRTGRAGIAQLATRGLTMAVFDHYDSRAGEPNLHTHVVISAKVRGTDGLWRALDARPLYRMTVAASEFYNTRFEAELVTRLARAGYAASFEARPGSGRNAEPVREIAGVPGEYIAFFSSRRAQVQARYQELTGAYRDAHGHDPPAGTCHQLARQANLDTRQTKGPARSLNQMRSDWQAALTSAYGPAATARVAAAIPARRRPPADIARKRPAPLDIEAAARQVIAAIEQARSTWTAWNVRAETERVIRLAGAAATPARHDQLATAVTERALSPGYSIPVTAPVLAAEPPALRRPGGESVFTDHGSARYTSAAILAAEQRLVTAAATPCAAGITTERTAALLTSAGQAGKSRLDAGQRALVTWFASAGTLLAVGIGPAGTGKTTAMRAFAGLAAAAGIRVIALAPSAAAAEVLAADTGLPADTVHKFLYEHACGRPGQLTVRRGDLILIDEAGMASTLHLDQVTAIAAARGAAVRLLGDYRQLPAPGCGGALRLIASRAGAAQLTDLYRFADPAEAAATLRLRDGDPAALDHYAARRRIRGGSLEAMTDAAYAGWKADMTAGHVTIMTAAAAATVTALSARARADRVTARQVEPGGVVLHDENLAGTGDWITTRANNRHLLTTAGDWVKNGDSWQVTARHPDGSLTARRLARSGTTRLPAAYTAAHVELLYATTTHRAQGATTDTAHPLITEQMTRENLYVAATRARHSTTFYVVTHQLPGPDPDDHLDRTRSDPAAHAAREILTAILSRQDAAQSATQVITDTLTAAESLAQLAPMFQHSLEIAVRPAYKKLLRNHYGDDRADALTQTPGYAQLRRALLAGEQAGCHPARLLARADPHPQASPLPDDQLIEQLTTRITDQARQHARHPRHPRRPPGGTPAWLTLPASAATALTPGIRDYLTDLSAVIASRITNLADLAAATQPTWGRSLGAQPQATADYETWKGCLASVAAYRDQHDITTTTDPRHPLGPRPEPGTGDEPAWQHATAAIMTARRLTLLNQPRPGHSPGSGPQPGSRPGVPATGTDIHQRALDAVPLALMPPPAEPRQHERQIGT
jgi:conjugative relaxase-like TrwC/TraI family protein